MSELAFQTAFAKLLIDGEVRSAALAGGTVPGLGLAEEDAARLRELDRERVEIYSELLLMNRLAKAVEALPFTTKALREHLWPLTLEWNRASPPIQSKKYDEAMSFGYFLRDTIGSRPYEPVYLRDLLLYEMSRLELRYTAVHDRPSNLPGNVMDQSPAFAVAMALANGAAVYPRRLPHARVLAFDHDVESILHELDQDRVPVDVDPCPSHMLMIVDKSGRVQQFAANLPTVAFVTAATGHDSFAEVLSWLAQVFQQEEAEAFHGLVASCVELCMTLLEQGVIALSDHPVSRDPEVALH